MEEATVGIMETLTIMIASQDVTIRAAVAQGAMKEEICEVAVIIIMVSFIRSLLIFPLI